MILLANLTASKNGCRIVPHIKVHSIVLLGVCLLYALATGSLSAQESGKQGAGKQGAGKQGAGKQGAGKQGAGTAKRYNVLFIMSDDLCNRLGTYGDSFAQTPNLDSLAARGARFDRAYCTFPLCGPSRNSMLTGLYPNSDGILTNGQIFRQTLPKHVSLPQAFRLDGYFTARVGKLYHYNVPNSVGTDGHDDPASWEVECNPAGVDRLKEHPRIHSLVPNQFGGTLSWLASDAPESQHTDALLADDAVWILERMARDRERPFFLSVGFFRPHTPYVAPQNYFEKFDRTKVPIVEGIDEDRRDIPPPGIASKKNEQEAMTTEVKQEAIQAYYASMSFMDAQVGKVIAALDRLGLADNTIIVFTSDHGYHLGEHGLWQKMSLFEESARVPLLIVVPGITKTNTILSTPISHLDLYPTLAELTGIKRPAALQGQSLVPMLKDPNVKGRGWALTQVTRGGANDRRFFGYSLRTDRFRYTEWDDGQKGKELYAHPQDIREQTNLADDPKYAADLKQVSDLLHQAVSQSFPADGVTPSLKPGLWAPNLTDNEE
jgi:iduronate 2-sulfatase